jgi:hypothetical protein
LLETWQDGKAGELKKGFSYFDFVNLPKYVAEFSASQAYKFIQTVPTKYVKNR